MKRIPDEKGKLDNIIKLVFIVWDRIFISAKEISEDIIVGNHLVQHRMIYENNFTDTENG